MADCQRRGRGSSCRNSCQSRTLDVLPSHPRSNLGSLLYVLTATFLAWWIERLPLASVESLSNHGMTDEEIYSFIVPRRTLVHRKTRRESLTHDESDRAVRVARITSLAEEVFGDDAKAGRWLRKPKTRFEGRTPFEMLRTEAGARLVEEMLLQLDYGFVA